VTAALRRFGVSDYTRKTTRVTARLPDAFEAKHLQISRTQPVLVAEFINVEPDGRPLEFGIGRFAADRIQLVIDT
jgi:GntR family phosphonate transport system transcriptional regulator